MFLISLQTLWIAQHWACGTEFEYERTRSIPVLFEKCPSLKKDQVRALISFCLKGVAQNEKFALHGWDIFPYDTVAHVLKQKSSDKFPT